MIALNTTKFARAANKARNLKPTVEKTSPGYLVARSNGQPAYVRFIVRAGQIWASCDCPAGTGENGRRDPLPCYHVAAALLTAALTHSHYCPTCRDLYTCNCPTCAAIENLPCNDCEADQINRLTWEAYQ